MQLETNQDGLTTHCPELGDAEPCNLHSTDACQELATGDSNKAPISDDEVTESTVLDNRGQLLHDAAVHNNAFQQKDSLILDVCNVDLCHAPPVLSSSDDVFKDQLGRNGLGEFNGESCAKTSGDRVSSDSLNTEEINVDEKQCSDVNEDTEQLNTYRKLIKKKTDCSSEIESTDEDATLDNGGNCLASEYSLRSNYMILLDSWYPGISAGESCYKDAHSSIVHDRCSADVDVTASKVPDVDLLWHTSADSPNSKVTEDTEIHHMLPDPDCENTKFADIPVEGRAQHIKLTLDHGEVDERIAQDQLSLLFSCILDKPQDLSQGFASAVEFPQNTDCLNAGIYASLGGMELRDDMELILVDDAKTDKKCNREGTDTVCDTNDYLNSMNSLTSVNNESNCTNAGFWNSASLGGMELLDTMELIPVDDEKTGREHSKYGTETIYDIDSQIYDDASEHLEVSYLTTNSHKTASTSHDEKQLETLSRDSCDIEVAQHDVEITSNCDALDKVDGAQTWPSDSRIKLLIAQEPTSQTSQKLQYTNTEYDVGEKLQYDLMLTPTEEVFDGSNENSQRTDKAEGKGRPSTALASSASDSVSSITEMQNVDTLVSLETINTDTASNGSTKMIDSLVSNSAPEMVESYVTKNRTLEDVENGEHENNTSFASNAYSRHSALADLEFLINAGFIENCVIEHHPDLPLLNNEETSLTVHYATEDSQFPVYEQDEKQLELFTVSDASLKTQRLELDDMTLTVTCFIPEESDELDDNLLGDHSDSEYVDIPSVSSNRKFTGNDPLVSNDLGHYMDHSVVGAGSIIPKRRSSEFMLSYLGPIDEAAEFTDDADEDTDDLVPDKSHLLQPDDINDINVTFNDINTDPSNNEEQEMAYNVNASPTVDDAYRLCHEPTENMQYDDVVDNGCKTKCFDDKEQITREESRSSVETPVERNSVNVYEKHNPWFSFRQQDTVGQVMSRNEYLSEDSVDDTARNTMAATDVAAVTHLHDNSSKHVTTAEHKILTNVSLPLHAGSVDRTGNTDNIFVPFAADSARHSAVYSVAKNAESSVSDFDGKHFLDVNAFRQSKVQEAGGARENLYNKHRNAEYKKRVDLDTEIFSNDEALLGSNSAVTHAAELEYDSGPWKQHVETALQLTESPVLRANNIRTAIDAILQGRLLRSRDKQDAIVEQPLLQTATNDRDMSHSFVSALRKSPPAGVISSIELEDPAIDAVTDFESILEQLHTAENTARND